MCEHIPCVPACPTGALDANLVSTAGKLDINKAKMGVAVVDMKTAWHTGAYSATLVIDLVRS